MCVSAVRRVWDAVDSARVARGAMGCRHSSPCAVAPTCVALGDEETLALERASSRRARCATARTRSSPRRSATTTALASTTTTRARRRTTPSPPSSPRRRPPRLAPRVVAPPRASLLVALRRETATFVRASRRRGCSTPSPTVAHRGSLLPGLLNAFAYSDASSALRAARLAPPRRPSSAVTRGYHGGDAAAPRGGVREPRAWSSSGWDPPGGWSYEREETTRLIAPSAAPVPDRRTVRASSSSARDGNPPGRERSRDEDGVFRDAFGDVPGTVPDSDRGGGGGARARALAPRAPVAFAAERGRDADRTRRGFLEQHPIDPTAIDRTSRNSRDSDPSAGGRSVARHHPSLAAGRRLSTRSVRSTTTRAAFASRRTRIRQTRIRPTRRTEHRSIPRGDPFPFAARRRASPQRRASPPPSRAAPPRARPPIRRRRTAPDPSDPSGACRWRRSDRRRCRPCRFAPTPRRGSSRPSRRRCERSRPNCERCRSPEEGTATGVPSKGNSDGATRRARNSLCRGGVAPNKARGKARAWSGRATSPAKRDPGRRGGPRARVSGESRGKPSAEEPSPNEDVLVTRRVM